MILCTYIFVIHPLYITLLEYRNCSFVMFCTWEKTEKNCDFRSVWAVCACVRACRIVNVRRCLCDCVSECMCHMHGEKPAVLSIYCEVFTDFFYFFFSIHCNLLGLCAVCMCLRV